MKNLVVFGLVCAFGWIICESLFSNPINDEVDRILDLMSIDDTL